MGYVTVKDGVQIYYKDWGEGQPIVFSHGWPLSADAWDAQMLFLVEKGYRVIAHDRRGHGRSDQPAHGNDMNTYADDLAAVLESLNIENAILVGHSTGGGEVVRYLSRHGTRRVVKAVLVGAVPPLMLQTSSNPDGISKDVFDAIRQGVADNRPQFYRELATAFFGFNRTQAVSQGLMDSFVSQGMMGGILGQHACVREFSEVDYTEDLASLDIPVLLIHGDDDQIVPIENSALKAIHLLQNGVLKVYAGASHGLCALDAVKLNQDLLEFINN